MQCLALPGPATSEVQVEAFKKLLLVLLIDPTNVAQHSGHLHVSPAALVTSLQRHRREVLVSAARQYVDFSKALAANDVHTVRKLASEQTAVFEKDGNEGLVHSATYAALPHRLLLELRSVYASAPLAVVADALGLTGNLDAAEAAVFQAVSFSQRL